jgi:N-methylhydantoinase A
LEKDIMPPVTTPEAVRLAVDIGGTFTDVVLETADSRFSAKVLSPPSRPRGRRARRHDAGIAALAAMEPGQVGLIVHGTTWPLTPSSSARARTALVTTKGFRI